MQENPWQKRFDRERAARKEAERLLEEKSLELYEANLSLEKKVKDAFLASMSHELRAPLNAIIGFAQILSKESVLPTRASLFVEKIHIAGNNLPRLINSLQERLLLVEPQTREKRLRLILHVEKIRLFADERLSGQGLLNLLANAVKFTPLSGDICISAFQTREWSVIKIKDSGEEIAQEQQAKLFAPFAHIQNTTQAKAHGTGLRLYISKKIVELHKGAIKLESKLGEGAAFSIYLPRKAV